MHVSRLPRNFRTKVLNCPNVWKRYYKVAWKPTWRTKRLPIARKIIVILMVEAFGGG
jgi:hypothetical protein